MSVVQRSFSEKAVPKGRYAQGYKSQSIPAMELLNYERYGRDI